MTEEERKERARERARKWYAENKERAKANVKKWKTNNKEKARELNRIGRARRYHEDPAKDLAYQKQWREKNPDIVHQRHVKRYVTQKESELARAKQWREDNPHKQRQYTIEYTAQKLKATPKWHEKEKHLIDTVYKKAHELGLEVDHVVPLRSKKVCGLHTWANLQLLDKTLNIKKRNRYWVDMP